MGYNNLNNKEIETFIGPPIQDSLISHYGCSKDEAQIGANIFRDYYKNISLLKAIPYDGIFELIKSIKHNGGNIAAATYKREDYALQLLNAFGFSDYCSVMHGGDNLNSLSKGDIIKKCVKEIGGNIGEFVYVGDTKGDFVSASECGMDFVGVTYGFGFEKNKKYNFCTVDSCSELGQLIDINNKR